MSNPSNPADSAVTSAQSVGWPEPAPAGERRQAYVLPAITRFIVHLLTVTAAIGVAVSLYIQVAAWTGLALPARDLVLGSSLACFVMVLVTMVVGVRLETSSARGRNDVPSWAQYAIYAFWANASINLFLALFVETGHDHAFTARFLSSLMLLAFMSIFTKLYAAARSRTPRAADAGIWREA